MYFADKAVDGMTGGGNIKNGHCSHTGDKTTNPPGWWMVDLQGLYYIESVTVHNRIDYGPG